MPDLGLDVDSTLVELRERNALDRLRSGDHTLWSDDPSEITDRLGWLQVVTEMQLRVPELEDFAESVSADGLAHAVLLGMGGSSLFPEVLSRSFGSTRLDLRVLDTTDPAPIARVAEELDLDRCLFVAASKSGTTIETRSQLDHFWELTGRDPRRFVVVTDPGSQLAAWGNTNDVRAVFENRPDIGGRFSALSLFGMVPAALLGVELAALLGEAARAKLDEAERLAATLGAAVRAGRDKLTLQLPNKVASFGLWLEQLIAESTGKQGTGILPVVGEPIGPAGVYGDDRLFVALGDGVEIDGQPLVALPFGDSLEIGAQVVVWEAAIALLGALLGINPFDQPDVEAAKAATTEVLAGRSKGDTVEEPVNELLATLKAGDHVCIQAFVDPGDDERLAAIERTRVAIRDRHRVATTVGVGPRYLHSTGQLHKGGPPNGVYLQVVGDDPRDVAIPGRPYSFGELKQAQAAGDLFALRQRKLRAARVNLDELLEVGR